MNFGINFQLSTRQSKILLYLPSHHGENGKSFYVLGNHRFQEGIQDMPVSYASGAIPAIHVIHENADWTAPLFDALEARGLPYVDWNMAYGDLALSEAPPQGVFYNRMSASSHTRGNRLLFFILYGSIHAWPDSLK